MSPRILISVLFFSCLRFAAAADDEPNFEAILLHPGNLKALSDAAQENVSIMPDNSVSIMPIFGSQRPFTLPNGEAIGELYLMRAMRTLVQVDALTDEHILKAFSSKERIVRCAAHLAFVARYGLDTTERLGMVLREEPVAGGKVAAAWSEFCHAKSIEAKGEGK